MIKKFFKNEDMDHKEVLLYGINIGFIVVFSLSIVMDYILEAPQSLLIDFISTILSMVSFYMLHYKKNILIAKFLVTLLTIIPVFFLIFVNHSTHFDIIFIILIPLVSFYIYNLKEALIVNTMIYTIIVALLYYIATIDASDIVLHNIFAIYNLILATIITMIFGLFYHFGIESALKKLKHSNKQKDILLKEVHHRVKNNLNIISAIIGLQAIKQTGLVKDNLLNSKSRIESIAIIHEMLYEYDDFEQISFYEYIIKLEKIIIEVHAHKIDYKIDINIDKTITFALDDMINFGIMLNEMLTNSIKHAKNKNILRISIGMKKNANYYIFYYRDNGENHVDVDNKLVENYSLGIKLINLSVVQLDAKINKHYNNGLNYEVKFKID